MVKQTRSRAITGVTALLLLSAAAVLITLNFSLPGNTIMSRVLQDTGHALLFGVLALGFLALVRNLVLANFTGQPVAAYAIVMTLCLVLAGLTEFWQIESANRDASILDFGRDLAGAATALGIYSLRDRGIEQFFTKSRRFLVATLSALTCIWIFAPLLSWSASYIHRRYQFPIIEDFSPRPWPSFVSKNDAELERIPADKLGPLPVEIGLEFLARIKFNKAQWPGIVLTEPSPDWSSARKLVFEVFNPSKTTRLLIIRIDDKAHSGAYSDRFTKSLTISPGWNSVKLSLRDVEISPETRQMDLGNVNRILLYSKSPETPFFLYLSAIRLEL